MIILISLHPPGLLPEGVTVIYREHFLLKLE